MPIVATKYKTTIAETGNDSSEKFYYSANGGIRVMYCVLYILEGFWEIMFPSLKLAAVVDEKRDKTNTHFSSDWGLTGFMQTWQIKLVTCPAKFDSLDLYLCRKCPQ